MGSARAGLTANTPTRFVSQHSAQLSLSVAQAYARLSDISTWWDPAHTWFGRSENLSLSLTAGGCFCERSGENQVEHLRVLVAQAGKRLRLQGGLGPLQALPLNAVMDWTFTPQENGTLVSLSYQVAGDVGVDLTTWSQAVDKVLAGQFARYATMVPQAQR